MTAIKRKVKFAIFLVSYVAMTLLKGNIERVASLLTCYLLTCYSQMLSTMSSFKDL